LITRQMEALHTNWCPSHELQRCYSKVASVRGSFLASTRRPSAFWVLTALLCKRQLIKFVVARFTLMQAILMAREFSRARILKLLTVPTVPISLQSLLMRVVAGRC